MAIDYIGLFSGISAVVIAISAVVALVVQSRRSQIALQTDLLLRLDEKFFGPEITMTKTRQIAAAKLLKGERPNYELHTILDSFTTVAYLLERKALDMDLTYKTFEYDLVRYWYCAKEHVIEARREDRETWLTLEALVNKLVALDNKRDMSPPTKEDLTIFLKKEAHVI